MNFDPSALAVPGVRGLRPYQPGKPESELRREYGLQRIVKLASNENPLGPGSAAREAAAEALVDCGRYPDGNGFDLKAALAAQFNLSAECLTLGNGSNDILELLARAFVTAADEVIYARHSFAIYALVTRAVGANARVAEANPAEHRQPCGHDLSAMGALLSERTRMVFIANPNNPTGTWLLAAELRDFLASIPQHVIVVVDEAYHEYVDEADYRSTVGWLAQHPNLVVTRTFSKAYGLAGLRVGYALSSAGVADLLNRVRQPFNVNMAALAAATAALNDYDHLRHSIDLNREQRERLRRDLSGLGLPSLPSAANFLCVRFGESAAAVYRGLLRQGVIVRPIENYGLPDHLRITVGTRQENDLLLKALSVVLGR